MEYFERDGAGYLKIENRIYAFSKTTGVVLEGGANKHVETHIHGSGGGGYISTVNGNGGGYIAPIQVSSANIVNQEFWIKAEDGSEVPIKLHNSDIPLRPGQKISMVSAVSESTNNSWWVMLVNHTSGQHYYLPDVNRYFFKNRMLMRYVPPLFIGLIASFMFGNKLSHLEFWLWAAFIAGVSYKFLIGPVIYSLQIKDVENAKSHLNELAQALYKNA